MTLINFLNNPVYKVGLYKKPPTKNETTLSLNTLFYVEGITIHLVFVSNLLIQSSSVSKLSNLKLAF